jgi:D-glucuronyl C5-epimerase C-terminus
VLAAVGAAAFVLVGASPAARPPSLQKQALTAVAKAVASGYLDGSTAAADRAEIGRAVRLITGLPSGRREPVETALREVAALSGKLSAPRAAAVFGQLKANDDYFSKHWPPAPQTDVPGPDGIVYRYFPGRCLEFHPLASFGALNADIAAKDAARTQTLAEALIARGVHEAGGGIGWEYDFDYAGGHAPWLSGMAQAVAAQALSRAAALVPSLSSSLTAQARAAFQTISPGLLTQTAAGPWIRLYGFNKAVVLNAQLQSVISLEAYAKTAQDATAAALATRMQNAAASMLGRFDTGFWSDYDLAGTPSPLNYQKFVNQLLKKLGPLDPRFASASQRFATYLTQPPAFRVANAGLGQVRFWLSKPSSVQLNSGAGPTRRLSLDAGWHTVGSQEPKHTGIYGVSVKATDFAGNAASFDALPIVRVVGAAPPKKKTSKAPRLAAPTAPAPTFTVGAGLDDPAQAPLAAQLGVQTVRMGIAWPVGSTVPDPTAIAALQQLPGGTSLVLELDTGTIPADDTTRAALATYAATVAQQLPVLHDLVLVPAAASASDASNYAATYAAVATAVKAVAPNVGLGVSIDGSAAPKTTVPAVARALAGNDLDVVAFRPAGTTAGGDWTAGSVSQLQAALQSGLGTAPPILLDGLGGTPDEDATALASAQCSPALAGAILDRVADSTDPEVPADGIFTATGTAKAGVKTLLAAIATAQHGEALCPGVSMPAAASTLTFPTSLSTASAASIQLGCVRACLYLVALERTDGSPVAAKRGELAGGAAPATVVLPKVALKPGAYRFDVRLVGQTNPGPIARTLSPSVTAG